MTNLMMRFDSDFPPNLFVIDPTGCGCLDCLTGMSTPLDVVHSDTLAAAVCHLGMEVHDRTGGELTVGLS